MAKSAAAESPREPRSGFARHLPILTWLPAYQKEWFATDFLAALTVVALLVPEGMAYAQIAGMPPQTAFYAAPPALILYALLGTSRQLVVAVSATIAVLSAATIAPLAAQGSPEYAALTAALALLAGLVSLLAGALKLGRLSQFFSESVLAGFVFGLALIIAIKQVPKIFGIEAGGEGFFERLWEILIHLPETHLPTLLVGAATLALLLLLEHYVERIPAALVALVFGIVVASIFHLEGRGVEVVGAIPAGLSAPKLPAVGLKDLFTLLAGACGIAIVSFAEAIGPVRSFATKHRYTIDPDQELIGLGAANVGAGLFGGFPIGSSLSKSAANDSAGGRTPLVLLIAAAVTALVALFLTGLFYNLPEATLGAIVLVAISGMMRVGVLKRLYRARQADFALAIVALFGVLIFDVLPGLLIAVLTSILVLVYRAARPRIVVLGREPGLLDLVDSAKSPGAHSIPGLLMLRLGEPLFFANASALRDEIIARVTASELPVRAVVLDLEATTDLDVPGADALAELSEDLEGRGVRLMLARVHAEVRALLDRSDATAKIGNENLQTRTLDGVLSYLARDGDLIEEERQLLATAITQFREIGATHQGGAAGDGDAGLTEALAHLERAATLLRDLTESTAGATPAPTNGAVNS